MSDPERLLSPAGDGSLLERELLSSVRDVAPPGDAKERAWHGVAAGITAAAVGVGAAAAASAGSSAVASGAAGASTANAGAATALSAGLTKVTLGVLLTSAAIGGGYWALQRPSKTEAPVSAPQAKIVAAPVVAPAPEASAIEPAPEPAAVTTEAPPSTISPRTSSKRAAGTPVELLAAESKLLTQARAQLQSGDVSGAQATLERLRSEVPSGVLGQEREVLAIQLLVQRGETAAARQRAERFIQAHPKSPHSEALRRFLQGS